MRRGKCTEFSGWSELIRTTISADEAKFPHSFWFTKLNNLNFHFHYHNSISSFLRGGINLTNENILQSHQSYARERVEFLLIFPPAFWIHLNSSLIRCRLSSLDIHCLFGDVKWFNVRLSGKIFMAIRHISVEMANKIENESKKRKINFRLRKQIKSKKEKWENFRFPISILFISRTFLMFLSFSLGSNVMMMWSRSQFE